MLGSGGDDWANYASWHLGIHDDQTPKTKAYYGYPFGKDGKVYQSALDAIRSRASQQNEADVFNAAGKLLDSLKKEATVTGKAYSRLDVKAVQEDDESYTITGIASTPTPDRMGDVVEPMGAKFQLPMPLLWQHQATMPVGTVNFAKPTKTGIPFTATLPKVKEAGNLKDRIDEAIQSIKYKMVTAVSIGFQALQGGIENLKDGGYRFN